MIASVQTAASRAPTVPSMIYRIGKSWQLWVTLAVIWTLVAAASAWIDLPRASGVPHDPEFLSKFSFESSAIVRGTANAVPSVRGAPAPLWSDTPRLLLMANGHRLAFPAFTTDQRASIVESEYRQLLDVRANEQRWPFLLERLAWWLVPLLIAGGALKSFSSGFDGHKSPRSKTNAGGVAHAAKRAADAAVCLPAHGQAWE